MQTLKSLQPWLWQAEQTLLAPFCWGCGTQPAQGCGFCWKCARTLFRQARPGDHLLPHEGPAIGLLRALRGAAPVRAVSLALRLLERSGQLQLWRRLGIELVLPAPQRPRPGASGLVLLTQAVALRIAAETTAPAFAKTPGRVQHGRSRRGRMDTECFLELSLPAAQVAGRKLLVLDDVATTGTTLELCAYHLRRAGAGHVALFSLAAQPPQAASERMRSLRP